MKRVGQNRPTHPAHAAFCWEVRAALQGAPEVSLGASWAPSLHQFVWGNSDLRRSVKFTTGSSFAWIFHLCFFHSLKFLLQMKALQPAVVAGTAPPALLWLWTHSSKPRTATDSRGQSSACKNMSKPAFKVFINDVLAFPAQCTDPF